VILDIRGSCIDQASYMTGVVSISMEVELAWEGHDTLKLDRLSHNGTEERRYLAKFLSVADQNEVPVSFDVAGHLFFE